MTADGRGDRRRAEKAMTDGMLARLSELRRRQGTSRLPRHPNPIKLGNNARALDVLAGWVEDRFMEVVGIDSCILGTAIVVDVLAAVGIRAEPLSVQAMVFGPTAVELLSKGIDPGTPKGKEVWDATKAWSVGIGFPLVPGQPRKPPVPGGRWNGHLVAITSDWLIDPTIAQAARPEHEINVSALVARLDRDWILGKERDLAGKMGQVGILYRLNRANRGWRSAPDWRSPKRRQVSEMFLAEIRAGRAPVRL